MALFNINDYYSSKIADTIGMLQGDIDIYIQCGLLPECKKTNFTLEDIDKQIYDLGNLDILSQYKIYTKEELCEKMEISISDFEGIKNNIVYRCTDDAGTDYYVLNNENLQQLTEEAPELLRQWEENREADIELSINTPENYYENHRKEQTSDDSNILEKEDVNFAVDESNKKKDKTKRPTYISKKDISSNRSSYQNSDNRSNNLKNEDDVAFKSAINKTEIYNYAKEEEIKKDNHKNNFEDNYEEKTDKYKREIDINEEKHSFFNEYSETAEKEQNSKFFKEKAEETKLNSFDDKSVSDISNEQFFETPDEEMLYDNFLSEENNADNQSEDNKLVFYSGTVTSEEAEITVTNSIRDNDWHVNSDISSLKPIEYEEQTETKRFYDKVSDSGMTITCNNEIVTEYYTEKENGTKNTYNANNLSEIPQNVSVYAVTDLGNQYELTQENISEIQNVYYNYNKNPQYAFSLPDAGEYAAAQNDVSFFESDKYSPILTYENYSGNKTSISSMADEEEKYISIRSNTDSYSKKYTEENNNANTNANTTKSETKTNNKNIIEKNDIETNSTISMNNVSLQKSTIDPTKKVSLSTTKKLLQQNYRMLSHTVGHTDAVMAIHQIKRYSAWVLPMTNAVLYGMQAKALKKAVNKELNLGVLNSKLVKSRVHSNVLQKRDRKGRLVYKRGVEGKYIKRNGRKVPELKKKLSHKEIENLRKMLNVRYNKGKLNCEKVDLRNLSPSKRKELMKKVSQTDKALLSLDKDLKKIADAHHLKKQSRKKTTRSLTSMIYCICSGADAVQGAHLIYQYSRIAVKGVHFAAWTGRTIKKGLKNGLSKVVKPYGRHVRRKQVKDKIKAKKKRQKKARRKRRRAARINKGIREITGKTPRRHKQHLINKYNNSKLGKGIAKTRKKLSPVKKLKNKVFMPINKITGGILGTVIKTVNLPAQIAKWIMIGMAVLVLFLGLQCISAAGVLQLFADIMGSDVAVIEDGKEEKNLVVATKDHLLDKDKAWLKEIEDEVKNKEKNEEAETAKDPFTGKTTTNKATGYTQWYFYNAGGYDTLDKDESKFKTSEAHKLNGTDYTIGGVYSNAKAIIATTSIYHSETGAKEDDTDGFIEFAEQLWDHTHIYQVAMSDESNYCSGKNCKSYIMDCRKLKNYKDKKDFKKNKYNFSNQVKKCSKKYYCNDPSSYKDVVYFADGSKTKPKGTGCKGVKKEKKIDASVYCSWSMHVNENPNIKNTVPNGAKGGITYTWKSDKNKAGTSFEGCTNASTIHVSSDFDETKVAAAIKNKKIVLVEGLVMRNNKYLAYCSNLQSIAKNIGKIKNQDGYILFESKYVNKKSKKIVKSMDGTYATNGIFSWFYECQGHKITGYKTNYCTGHTGCIGHKVTYCLGHKQLEAHVCIAGLTEDETKSQNTNGQKSMFYVDNKFWRKEKGKYDKKWNGFLDSHFDWAELIMANDWERSYGIKEDDFKLRDISAAIVPMN